MSSRDEWDDPYRDEFRDDRFDQHDPGREDESEQRPAKKMNPVLKVVIVILCIIGGGTLVCCGGVAWFMSSFVSGLSDDPEIVRSVTQEIVEIKVPDTFQPVGSISFDVMFLPSLKLATYERRDRSGMLTLVEIGLTFESDDAAAERQVNQMLRDQGQELPRLEIDEASIEYRKFRFRGQPVDVKFAKATDLETERPVRVVEALFDGTEGTVMLMLVLSEDEYDEAEVEEMLNSIP